MFIGSAPEVKFCSNHKWIKSFFCIGPRIPELEQHRTTDSLEEKLPPIVHSCPDQDQRDEDWQRSAQEHPWHHRLQGQDLGKPVLRHRRSGFTQSRIRSGPGDQRWPAGLRE